MQTIAHEAEAVPPQNGSVPYEALIAHDPLLSADDAMILPYFFRYIPDESLPDTVREIGAKLGISLKWASYDAEDSGDFDNEAMLAHLKSEGDDDMPEKLAAETGEQGWSRCAAWVNEDGEIIVWYARQIAPVCGAN